MSTTCRRPRAGEAGGGAIVSSGDAVHGRFFLRGVDPTRSERGEEVVR